MSTVAGTATLNAAAKPRKEKALRREISSKLYLSLMATSCPLRCLLVTCGGCSRRRLSANWPWGQCPLWVKSRHVQRTSRCPLCANSGHEAASRTTSLILLHRRTRHRAVRTEHAAVTRKWLESFSAAFAIVKDLTGICRHLLGGCMTAFRAGYDRFCKHAILCAGQPQSALACDEPADLLG
jgi:hypothetical protein